MSELTVMMSAGFKAAYLELAPRYERESGHRLATLWVPSADIPRRLQAGEIVDLVIGSAPSLDAMIAAGHLAKPRVDLATCGVAAAVKSGARKPDLESAEDLKRAVLHAWGVVYSQGPSGVYLEQLFERMGIAGEIAHKVKRVKGEPAGEVVARGEAELGFQQMSELLPVEGIDIVGPLPDEVQEITTFSAGVHARAPSPEAARALVEYLQAPAAASVIEASGMKAWR